MRPSRRSVRHHARRGVALATALVALVVIAGLGAGALLASRETRRAAYDALAVRRADIRAAGAVEAALRPWDRRRNQLDVGQGDSTPVGGDVVRVERLDRTRFVVEASSRANAAAPGVAAFAERTISALVRLVPPSVDALAAVTVGGPIALLDGASVDGRDTTPPAWAACAGPAVDTAAIVAPGQGAVTTAPQSTMHGALKQQSAAADISTYTTYGAESWSTLASRADVVVDVAGGARSPTPRSAGAACVLGADTWSEPLRGGSAVDACATTFPIVLARGGLALHDGRAQGVLLVDGDLDLDGTFTFAGVIVVHGALHADHGALRLHGALLVSGGGTALGDGSDVRFSRCAVTRALDGVARAEALRRRSWAEVTR